MTLVADVPVEWFAGEMRRVLGEPKNIVKHHWSAVHDINLINGILKNAAALSEASWKGKYQDVIDRAVDIANLSLMIADKANMTKAREV